MTTATRRAAGFGLAVVGLAGLVGCGGMASADVVPLPFPVHEHLVRDIGLSAGEVSALAQGRVVVKVLDPGDRREVALAGIVRIEAPRHRMVDAWRDIVEFRRGEHVLEMGAFSKPPRVEDLAALTVDRHNLDDLAQCRPGSCKLQLTAPHIERFAREIDWRAAGRATAITRLMHAVLFEHLEHYRTGGLAALGAYADRRQEVDIGAEIRSVLSQTPSPLMLVPELMPALIGYPRVTAPGAEEGFYWAKERFGYKPVTALTHTTLYDPRPDRGISVLVSRQIYANHYFDASVGVSAVLDVPGRAGEAFDLLYVNRTRSARMTGLFGGIARSMAQGRARDAMTSMLGAIKARTEREAKDGNRGR